MDATPIIKLKGIGEKTQKYFSKLEIQTTNDLLYYFPKDYDTFESPVLSSSVMSGRICALKLTIRNVSAVKKVRNLSILNMDAFDQGGIVHLTFFNMTFLTKVMKPGSTYVFRGNATRKGLDLCMEQPKYYSCQEYYDYIGVLQPKYHLTKGLSNATIQKAITNVLKDYFFVEEYLPQSFLDNNDFMTNKQAIRNMHFPDNMDILQKARKRLAFDELFGFLYVLRKNKDINTKLANEFVMLETADTVRFLERLPYSLTNGQKKVWQDIKEDFASPNCMNRLIQGDVGSGKTIVAELALLMCVSNGLQGAFMAPTEVLAMQHFETFMNHVKEYQLPFKPVLLVGSMTAKEKREAYEGIKQGNYNVIIGTHALIQEKVEYDSLALVITDEQHRFGVRQREALSKKGKNPHILVMSATPIPRTLSLILYGDLDISVISELPSNRLPIKNCVVNTNYRPKAYNFIEDQVRQGRQAFVICPMVEEGELEDVENVIEYTDKLKAVLNPSIQVRYLHGKMSSKEKNDIMEAFAKKDIDVLVSTTVIEVGINVPNATVMMVENAERFGLAQLHQLRGRVGRGEYQSYCIFINTKENDQTKERLDILGKSNDGFFIASEDMRLRGPGDIFGIRQSGDFSFQIADIFSDADMLELAKKTVDSLFEREEIYLSEEEKNMITYMNQHMINVVDFRSI